MAGNVPVKRSIRAMTAAALAFVTLKDCSGSNEPAPTDRGSGSAASMNIAIGTASGTPAGPPSSRHRSAPSPRRQPGERRRQRRRRRIHRPRRGRVAWGPWTKVAMIPRGAASGLDPVRGDVDHAVGSWPPPACRGRHPCRHRLSLVAAHGLAHTARAALVQGVPNLVDAVGYVSPQGSGAYRLQPRPLTLLPVDAAAGCDSVKSCLPGAPSRGWADCRELLIPIPTTPIVADKPTSPTDRDGIELTEAECPQEVDSAWQDAPQHNRIVHIEGHSHAHDARRTRAEPPASRMRRR